MSWLSLAIALCLAVGTTTFANAEAPPAKPAQPKAAAAAATPAPASPTARLITAKPAAQAVTLTGFTRARAEIKLISEVAGRCLAVEAEVGDVIGKKGVFARLDATFTKLELENNLVEQSRLKSRLAYLEKDLKRTRTLVARKSQAQAKLDSQEQEFDQAKHQLQALGVQAKTLRERISRHTIKAPAGWQVMERKVEPGQWVAAGFEVGRVGDFRTLLVPLALTPGEYDALSGLQKISLKFPASGRQVPARIYRVSPAFDPATRKIKLDLAIDDNLAKKRGGLRAELTLDLPDASGAVWVPTFAVSQRYQEFWLERASGGKVRVMVLGPGPEPDTLRVTSPEVKPGQRFRLQNP
jgi:membrane fusion protein (multidrug efflux system)